MHTTYSKQNFQVNDVSFTFLFLLRTKPVQPQIVLLSSNEKYSTATDSIYSSRLPSSSLFGFSNENSV